MNPNDLIQKAEDAARNAHAPYSGYQVGAALLCSDGTVFTGCNVENASFGLTNCAERTALFSAVAAGKSEFKALAVTALGDQTPFPCGACRQVLAEFCREDFAVYIAGNGDIKTVTLAELLPFTFKFRKSDA